MRCCSPPESSLGRASARSSRPTRSRQLAGARASLALVDRREPERNGHELLGRQLARERLPVVLIRVAENVAAVTRELPRRTRGRGRARRRRPSRPTGARGPASTRMSVVLPEPLGPSTTQISRSSTVEREAAQRRDAAGRRTDRRRTGRARRRSAAIVRPLRCSGRAAPRRRAASPRRRARRRAARTRRRRRPRRADRRSRRAAARRSPPRAVTETSLVTRVTRSKPVSDAGHEPGDRERERPRADDAAQQRRRAALRLELVQLAAVVPEIRAARRARARRPRARARGAPPHRARRACRARAGRAAPRARARRASTRRGRGTAARASRAATAGSRPSATSIQTSFSRAAPGAAALIAVRSAPRSPTTISPVAPGKRSTTPATRTFATAPADPERQDAADAARELGEPRRREDRRQLDVRDLRGRAGAPCAAA